MPTILYSKGTMCDFWGELRSVDKGLKWCVGVFIYGIYFTKLQIVF